MHLHPSAAHMAPRRSPVVLGVALAVGLSVGLAAQNTGITLTNGVDGLIEIPYSPQVVPQSGFTFEAWVTYDDSTIPQAWTWPTIARQNQTAGSESWFLRVQAANTSSTVLGFLVQTANGTRTTVNWPFTPGQLTTWTHVAATYDGATSRLFVNGVQVGSQPVSGGSLRDQGGTLRIGKGSDVGGPIEVWNGSIDEARLWPFARTAGEIQATMNMELGFVPGLVSTWNFNNSLMDSSSTLHATAQGTVPFAANTLNLTPLGNVIGIAYGTSTAGCLGPIEVSATSLPTVGNSDFAVVCTRVPANALAIGLLGFASANPTLRVLGLDVFVDPTGSDWLLLNASNLGTVRFDLPIPATVSSGLQFAVQFAALDPCGPQGWTASNALASAVQ